MAKKRRGSWQDRRPSGAGGRLLDGEVPDGGPRGGGGVFGSFSLRVALLLVGLGLFAALISQYAC